MAKRKPNIKSVRAQQDNIASVSKQYTVFAPAASSCQPPDDWRREGRDCRRALRVWNWEVVDGFYLNYRWEYMKIFLLSRSFKVKASLSTGRPPRLDRT